MDFNRKVDGAVILPNLKIAENTSYFVKFLQPITITARTGQDGKATEVSVARIINLVDNKMYTMVCGKLLADAMIQLSDYVGKSFEIIKTPVEGKRFKKYEIYEIDAK